MRSAFRRGFRSSLLVILAIAPLLLANDIPVRFTEGLSRGFLLVTDQNGRKIGHGDDQQVVRGGRIDNHLSIHFTDGSVYDETTVFSEERVFRLISDHVIEKGPSFNRPLDGLIDASKGQITIRYADGHGREKTVNKRMKLPADIANGMLFVLVKDIDPKSPQTWVSYLSLGPHPRLVKLVFTPKGKSPFSTAGVRREAMHYIMHVDIGGIAGVVAPIIGKQPHDTHVWVIGGDAPTYAASEGPLYGEGPVWKISLVSPEEAMDDEAGKK